MTRGIVAVWNRYASRLGVRLALLLAITLLPLGVLTVQQTAEVRRQAVARAEAALMGETLRAAAPEIEAIQTAQGVLRALSVSLDPLLDDTAACIRLMDRIAGDHPEYSLVAFVPISGLMTCASGGRTADLSSTPRFAELTHIPEPRFIANPKGPVSGVSVLNISQPVFDDAGRHQGIATLSIPHDALDALTSTDEPVGSGDMMREPIALITFNQEGVILTSSLGMDEAPNRIPADRALAGLARDRPTSFTGLAVNGNERLYSVVPIADGRLFVLASWPVEQPSSLFGYNVPSGLFPLLMWLASLIVALLAAEFLVTRHIRDLGRSMLAFSSGQRVMQELDLRSSPQEIRDVGDAYLRMTETILHDEAEMEDVIHQKEVLLREVHHRVKNNLQLIASIMSMQMRKAKSPEAKELMKGLQERVMSLATIHRELYQTSGLTDIRAEELFRDIVRQIVSMATAPGHRFAVTTSFDDLLLTPDQAVPLALLLTEAMTNALKYAAAAPGQRPTLDIRLLRDGTTGATLTVTNSVAEDAPAPADAMTGSGLGSQLAAAFASQLGGRLTAGRIDESFVMKIAFEVKALREAEAKNSPVSVDP